MDCEKFESTMVDELYEELDELTSAAAKRHVAGCARCASLFGGLRATRRVAVLPLIEPPSDLEDRILAAARQAHKVVPLRTRVARAVSTAGSWAMRPQTAMAALFLLMIGSSFLFLQGRRSKSPPSSVTVSQLGAPAPPASVALGPARDQDLASAAKAHGTDSRGKKGGASQSQSAADGMNKDENGALARSSPALAKLADDNASLEQQRGVAIANAAPIAGPGNYGGLPPSPAPAEVNAPGAPNASGYGGYGGAGSFDQAKSEYDKGRYTSAYAGFSALAANDPNSALWAARTKQAISGPAGAAREFDQLAQRLSGTTYGYSATLEGARCYRLMGAYDVAREHLSRLRGVPSFDTQAQNELDLINAAIAHPQAPAATATASAPANATRQ